MLSNARKILERILDAVDFLVSWAVVWFLILVVGGMLLMLLGIAASESEIAWLRYFATALYSVWFGGGILLALFDLYLRARSKPSLIVAIQTSRFVNFIDVAIRNFLEFF